jgi:hypothetical protein
MYAGLRFFYYKSNQAILLYFKKWRKYKKKPWFPFKNTGFQR